MHACMHVCHLDNYFLSLNYYLPTYARYIGHNTMTARNGLSKNRLLHAVHEHA